MKTVALGATGVLVSELCLGTMMFGERCDEAEAGRILGMAIDCGINWIDTAALYAEGWTEEILGRILKGRRERLFIATKVHKGTDGESIRSSIDESLRRMRVDHVDLYMIHWPRLGMHPVEMMEALNEVVVQGKSRYVGFSNCPAWLFAHLNAIAEQNNWSPLVCNQVPYNLLERGIEVEVLPQATAEGIALTTYRALVMGLLTGKYTKGRPLPAETRARTDPRIAAWLDRYGEGIERLRQIAERLGVPLAHLAIAWVRHNPAVTAPVIGVSSVEQLNASLGAFDLDLTPEVLAEITACFDTAVKEEAGGKFPEMRRELRLLD
ncbi:MAG: aldo/keto reductase [Ardenticatenaceae bacterium]|nr:aldo/keto reductase [Ardenticatenaceae bacterium]